MASVLDSIDEFLSRCQQSGDAAYAALRSVLDRLDDPATRVRARVFLDDIKRRFPTKDDCDRCFSSYHFRIDDIFLDQYEGYHGRKKLSSMVIPSIFIPEDWSFTFFEGLNRPPDSIFKDQTVAELGCGNGWISIAIADKWLPFKVYGLDINPRAVKISWINLYLNALDEKGQPILDSENRTLLDRVEFHESDLLAYCRDNDIQLERIVGCIPQILNPNPDAMSKMITENASEEFLHSLSNYCALQGFVEDQFGLGLIARAVEEGISVIKSTGIMIFNMGGRPGQGVCKRLFERRGFRITKLWQTKILQAADTDISALVEIEKNSPHRFEFFMGLSGDQPICARTAWAYGKAGGRISHALSVYSCQLRQPNQVKTIFDFLKSGFQEISGSLDLSFQDDSVADEKISFLAYLGSIFKETACFPYEPPAGSLRFRSLIAGFMKKYHHIPLNSGNVVVFPSRAVAIENALRLFSPRLAIVDEHLTRHLPRQWLTSLNIETGIGRAADDVRTVIEAPSQSDLMIELIKKLKPQVVVTGMAHFEAVTSSAFVQLLDVTREIGSRLFIDISDHFELSSLPSSNGVLKYLAGNSLPSHAAILCGLVKNQVYMDLEVAFVISEEEPILKALSKTVELLEGNTAPISQYYYGCLFHELLSFQLPDRHLPAQRKCDKSASSTDIIGFSSSAISVLNNAELSIDQIENSYLIHMDVDQSFLPTPFPVKAAIFESFSRQNMSESEIDITTSIKQFVKTTYGFPFGLEFDYEGWGGWNLEGVLSRLYLSSSSFSVCLLGELSSMMLTGALKFGFLALNQLPLIDLFHSFSGLSRPHSTVKYAIKKLLGLREKKSEEMWGAVTRQIKDLRSRSRRLAETLGSCGWDVLEPHAGFSTVAKPTLYSNKTTRLKNAIDYEVKLDDSNIRGAILKATGLCINSSSWTGIPGYCRFTIALEESEFQKALDCIAEFKRIACL
ncbi:methionine S-methyltransferase-like isoform X2 [Cucurbita moschata]|uniref:methionine S-methyltransferase n=1 Tax=Cucurbita moschata TaxID=3662 RepID=A0A6J1FNR9_CUCMO|nr:methionine S-methyltransferase-like isoform X2 [Cucurbita moschata]